MMGAGGVRRESIFRWEAHRHGTKTTQLHMMLFKMILQLKVCQPQRGQQLLLQYCHQTSATSCSLHMHAHTRAIKLATRTEEDLHSLDRSHWPLNNYAVCTWWRLTTLPYPTWRTHAQETDIRILCALLKSSFNRKQTLLHGLNKHPFPCIR